MSKLYTRLLAWACRSWGLQAAAQAPALPVKANLSQTLLTNRSLSNAAQVDTVQLPAALPAGYTPEVGAGLNAASPRSDRYMFNTAISSFCFYRR